MPTIWKKVVGNARREVSARFRARRWRREKRKKKALPSIRRSPPSVARLVSSRRTAGRGERRGLEPRDVPSGCSRVVASGSLNAGRLDERTRASRRRSEGGASSSRVSSSRRRTRRGFYARGRTTRPTRRPRESREHARARWMTHLVPHSPIPRAPLHHLQLVLDQSELLRAGRAFARAGRGR